MSSRNGHHDVFQGPRLFDDHGNLLPSSPLFPMFDQGCHAQSARSSTDDDKYSDGSEEMSTAYSACPRLTSRLRNSAPESFSASRSIFPSPTLRIPATIAVALQTSVESARATLLNLQELMDSCDLKNLSDMLTEDILHDVHRAYSRSRLAGELNDSKSESEGDEDTALAGTDNRVGMDNEVEELPHGLLACTRNSKSVDLCGFNCATCNKLLTLLRNHDTVHLLRAMQTNETATPNVILPQEVEATTIPHPASPFNAESDRPMVRLLRAPRREQSSPSDLLRVDKAVASPKLAVFPKLAAYPKLAAFPKPPVAPKVAASLHDSVWSKQGDSDDLSDTRDVPGTFPDSSDGDNAAELARLIARYPTLNRRSVSFTSTPASACESPSTTERSLSTVSEELPWTPRSPAYYRRLTNAITTPTYNEGDESAYSGSAYGEPDSIVLSDSGHAVVRAAAVSADDPKSDEQSLNELLNVLFFAIICLIIAVMLTCGAPMCPTVGDERMSSDEIL